MYLTSQGKGSRDDKQTKGPIQARGTHFEDSDICHLDRGTVTHWTMCNGVVMLCTGHPSTGEVWSLRHDACNSLLPPTKLAEPIQTLPPRLVNYRTSRNRRFITSVFLESCEQLTTIMHCVSSIITSKTGFTNSDVRSKASSSHGVGSSHSLPAL